MKTFFGYLRHLRPIERWILLTILTVLALALSHLALDWINTRMYPAQIQKTKASPVSTVQEESSEKSSTPPPTLALPTAHQMPPKGTADPLKPLAAAMLIAHHEKLNRLTVKACSAVGVVIHRYETAMTRAYATDLALSHALLGEGIDMMDTFFKYGAAEGERLATADLDAFALSNALSRRDACRYYDTNADKVVAANHFERLQREVFKRLIALP